MELAKFYKKLARTLSNEELELLRTTVQEEVKRREELFIASGSYIKPLPEELTGNKVNQIMSYKYRTGYSISLSKMIIDKHW